MDSISSFAENIADQVEAFISNLETVRAEQLGLDFRAGSTLYVDGDRSAIGVKILRRGQLEYYGGFEYVDKASVKAMGDYVFYLASDDRVAGCLDVLDGKPNREFQNDDDE